MFRRITAFFSEFPSSSTENPPDSSKEAAKNAKMERKRELEICSFVQRKMDIRNLLRVDPSSRQWLDHTDAYAEQAREKELVLEQELGEVTDRPRDENWHRREHETIETITRMMSMLKYQMYDLFQFYHILRWEETRFDIYKAQVEEYLSKYIEDALFIENLMRNFCAYSKNTRYSVAIFRPEHIECIKHRAIAYHLQLRLQEAAYCLEGTALSLPDILWNLKTKEWMLAPTKKAKKNKSGKKQVEKHTLTKKAEQRSKKTTEYMRDCESVLNLIDSGEQTSLLSQQHLT
ncbi:hypothetical protein PRIPAC_97154 [Pristionchus pacificus]|uniref:Uncharacterized protein n=1 Tax=Pristionchus pacificus TaxID=54126 RepID=A0A2A6CUN4_PRIPA|nr:hypothetical protein PRIPAC_97154 [Pristionchus pacificus]|eukprot:PDM81753.1 hypothetical protein PRIPAC_37595 [Pristionchus pacificus]